jgi:uncharacterized membrane protein
MLVAIITLYIVYENVNIDNELGLNLLLLVIRCLTRVYAKSKAISWKRQLPHIDD